MAAHLEFGHNRFSLFCTIKTSLIHSDSDWWWQPFWILPCWIETLPSWIQTPCYHFSDSLKNTLTPIWLWLNIFNLTETHSFSPNLMMVAILNSVILDSAILRIHSQTLCTKLWLKTNSHHLAHKKTSLIHSHSTWWWQPSWNSAMLDSYTAILDSDTFLSPLTFTQKHSHSNLTLTQHNSIWLKLIHSHLAWWWQPFWILPCWIQPFWTKKTSLIHSDSTWWWQPSVKSCHLRFNYFSQNTSFIHSDSTR